MWFSHWNGLFVVYVSHMLAPLMPRVTRGPRRPPRHAWHRLAQASLAGPAPASLPAIMAAPALAIGAAEEASGRSFEALSAKMNVHVRCTSYHSHVYLAVGKLYRTSSSGVITGRDRLWQPPVPNPLSSSFVQQGYVAEILRWASANFFRYRCTFFIGAYPDFSV